MISTLTRASGRAPAVLVACLGLAAAACGGPSVKTKEAALAELAKVPASSWAALAQKRLWFGHQSVGADIMQGVADLVAEGAVPLSPPVEARTSSAFPSPRFAHALNGENEKPDLKIRAFAEFVDDEIGGEVDIAFFKFCYVDIRPETDVEALFADYRGAMDGLKAKYPGVRFVHVTSPLTVVQGGMKVAIKKVLGRPQKDYTANAKRNEFNRLLLDTYDGREPVFDLARVESTYPDGSRRTFTLDGKTYHALIEGYSQDGKHLDENGRRWVAAHLLASLARLT